MADSKALISQRLAILFIMYEKPSYFSRIQLPIVHVIFVSHCQDVFKVNFSGLYEVSVWSAANAFCNKCPFN